MQQSIVILCQTWYIPGNSTVFKTATKGGAWWALPSLTQFSQTHRARPTHAWKLTGASRLLCLRFLWGLSYTKRQWCRYIVSIQRSQQGQKKTGQVWLIKECINYHGNDMNEIQRITSLKYVGRERSWGRTRVYRRKYI